MIYPLANGRYIFRALKQGASGWDVVALQLGLHALGSPIGHDGIFGPATITAVKELQTQEKLIVDGIAGLATQRTVLLECLWPHQRAHRTPPGLARGMIEGECGFQIGNYTAPYPSGNRDIGCTMRNLMPSDENLLSAFDPAFSIDKLCQRLREGERQLPFGHDDNFGKPGAKTHKRAWELAVLSWNWPAASQTLVNGGNLSTAPAQWVINIGVKGVISPAGWAEHYIASKTLYVPEDGWRE